LALYRSLESLFKAAPIAENIMPKITASFDRNLILGKASNNAVTITDKIKPNKEYINQILLDVFIMKRSLLC